MGLRLHWLQIAALAVMLGSVASCSEQKMPTQVMVVIGAEGGLASLASSLRVDVEALDRDDQAPFSDTLDATSIGSDPVLVPLLPKDGDATREYTVTTELFDEAGASLGVQQVESGYVQGELREIKLVFEDVCRDGLCPEGFRCYEGECAEYCVEPETKDSIEGSSSPVACGEACVETACRGDEGNENLLRCVDGYGVVEHECGFGCDGQTACNQLIPSNVPDFEGWDTNLADLVVGDGNTVVFDTDTGAITGPDETVLRPAGEDELDGIVFLGIDDSYEIPVDADLIEEELGYGVFQLSRLTVLDGATLRGTGQRALVLLVNRSVHVLGELSVAATSQQSGPGGYRGGAGGDDAPSGGDGPGGGHPGTPSVNLSSGGGGASFSGLGGFGGFANSIGVRGNPGDVYGTVELIPLIGGSGGGEGGEDGVAAGGHGGGALQIGTNGHLVIGPNGIIDAGGQGGQGSSMLDASGGAGGGSGGAILLEAGSLVFTPGQSEGLPRVGAQGGGAGGGGESAGSGSDADGAAGHPKEVPAAGGIGDGSGAEGGNGSNHQGTAGNGNFGFSSGGGGGGGGGRIRINTLNGESDRVTLAPFVTPRSEATFTVGNACVVGGLCPSDE